MGGWELQLPDAKQRHVGMSSYTALQGKDPNSKLNVQSA